MTAEQSADDAPHPDFHTREFLLRHVADTLKFYHPHCIDPAGGFFHFFRDDGHIYDRHTRHLVSSSRFVLNYTLAWHMFGEESYRDAARHGLDYLRNAHRNPDSGGYAWQLRNGEVIDATNHCYGLAFVAMTYARALQAGIGEAAEWLDETWHLMETHFWDARYGLYADEASAEWTVSDYRGQNANMHACEAWQAAYEATHEKRYLERAMLLTDNMVNRQAALSGGMIWEHYHHDWSIDWEYNKGDNSNIFRPWGYQPGHQTEWARMLLTLDRHAPADWHLPKARAMFDNAVALSWDAHHGGMVYGLDTEGGFNDTDKYYWVQSESAATAALLAARSGESAYLDWYNRLWAYSWNHLVDHRHGAWYRILSRDNRRYNDEKSPAGKTDYHTISTCYMMLDALAEHTNAESSTDA